MRLFTRRGHDWTECYPAVAAVAAKLRAKSFTLDGEAVVTGTDGVAVFDALHRRHKPTDAMLYAFGLLELGGRGTSACMPWRLRQRRRRTFEPGQRLIQVCTVISHVSPSGRQSNNIWPFNWPRTMRSITRVPKP